jgi:hypothetical protein
MLVEFDDKLKESLVYFYKNCNELTQIRYGNFTPKVVDKRNTSDTVPVRTLGMRVNYTGAFAGRYFGFIY